MAEAKIKKACKDLSLPLKPSATKVRPETGCKFARDLDKDIAMDSSTRVVVAVPSPPHTLFCTGITLSDLAGRARDRRYGAEIAARLCDGQHEEPAGADV